MCTATHHWMQYMKTQPDMHCNFSIICFRIVRNSTEKGWLRIGGRSYLVSFHFASDCYELTCIYRWHILNIYSRELLRCLCHCTQSNTIT